jgi:hypothetical protein
VRRKAADSNRTAETAAAVSVDKGGNGRFEDRGVAKSGCDKFEKGRIAPNSVGFDEKFIQQK